jgi:hypothetical protein
MASVARRSNRVLIEADDRGRVSLGRFGIRSMQLLAEQTPDGGVVLHPAVAMTAAEAAHYGDPEAVRLLNESLAAADAGRVDTFEMRSSRTR